ncbi:MAG: RAMP superfamily CRISPR-associated protein [Candidatus Methanosuratincola sp.]|jgi:CRISPR-associated protein Cmr2
MSYDLYARFLDSNRNIVLWNDVERLVLSLAAQTDLVALFLAKYKEDGRKKLEEILRKREFAQELRLCCEQLCRLGINEQLPEINKLPKGSHIIQITFTLRKPYLSRDDKEFYILDNPVAKDPAFKIPIIRPSSWKGALRWVTRNALSRSGAFVERLFGNEKETQRAKQGRLIFYTTFLDQVSLDVITPLRRETRTPRRGPILFEMVPVGSRGTFSVLYFPFDLLHLLRQGDSTAKAIATDEIKEDLETLKEAIPAMLMTYGFAAKKTSGYGVIEDAIDFRIDSVEMKAKNFDEFKKQMVFLMEKIGED